MLCNVPSRLDITFDHSPKAGLTIREGKGQKYENVVFKNCTFDNVILENCFLKNVIFENCTFKDVKLSEIVLLSLNYIECNFFGCIWKWRRLEGGRPRERQTYRRGGEQGINVPKEIKQATDQQERTEEHHAQYGYNVGRVPWGKKGWKKNKDVRSPEEIHQAGLSAGERSTIYVPPGAVDAPKSGAGGTCFVTFKSED